MPEKEAATSLVSTSKLRGDNKHIYTIFIYMYISSYWMYTYTETETCMKTESAKMKCGNTSKVGIMRIINAFCVSNRNRFVFQFNTIQYHIYKS